MNPRAITAGALAAVALTLAAAISSASDAATTSRIVLESGGRARVATLYAPESDANPLRLVVMLHAAGGRPARIRHLTAYGLERQALRGRWIVAYPKGVGGTWNDCRRTPRYPAKLARVDDVAYLRELIAQLRERYAIAAADVLVAGYSNGAHMALRVAVEAPADIGGIALVAAQMPAPAENQCEGGLEVPNALLVAGTADPLIPFAGGASFGADGEPLGEVLSVAQTMNVLTARIGSRVPQRVVSLPEVDGDPGTSVELTQWDRPNRSVVRLYTLRGAGHVVPQRDVRFPAFVGRSSGDVDFGEIVLGFVEAWPATQARHASSSGTLTTRR